MGAESCWALDLCFVVYVAVGIAWCVLTGYCRDLGEMLGGADGASWLLRVCPEIAGGSRLRGTLLYLGAKIDRDGWGGGAQKLKRWQRDRARGAWLPLGCLVGCLP